MLAYFARPLWKLAAILIIILPALVGGTWAIQTFTIERLLYQDAVATGHNWASYLAQNVADLTDIAKGEQPSSASMAFFETAQKAGSVFRYKIFSPDGHLRLVSDELSALGSDKQNLVEHNAAAAKAIAAGQPLVVAKEGKPPARPPFFSEAYVPVIVDGKTIAIAEAYVDQTEKRENFHAALTVAAASLSLLMAFAFCIPATAWFLRTKEKLRAEERNRFLAYHDTLTGLPNRNQVIETLGQRLAAAIAQGKSLAVHYIDLDNFKNVNDSLGHNIGDRLIISAAERLREIADPSDIVARVGGDEFLLLQCNLNAAPMAEQMASRIIETLDKPFAVDGHEIITTTSVGVAMAPRDGDNPTQLIRSADLAMYKSKASGRNRASFFIPAMDIELRSKLELEKIIRDATLNKNFELFYQPVVSSPESSLVGFEALLRLRAADGSLLSPAIFIPVAERMGLIIEIGAWVIGEACRTAATWPDHLTVAVNLSPAQFARNSVCGIVASALAETGLAPHRLELEVTESLLLEQSKVVLEELSKLKSLGVAVVMDDFGTGYSSLGYLWQFPFEKIKIDRSFMLGFDTTEQHAKKVIHTIVNLARSLDMRVTVEGVEKRRQLDFVQRTKCDQVQGFYYGRPMPATDIAAHILGGFHKIQPDRQDSSETAPTIQNVNKKNGAALPRR